MEIAVKKTYEAMPSPKFVVAVGDDACDGGIYKGTYAVSAGVDKVLPVDLKIPGNPPTPAQIPRRPACAHEKRGKDPVIPDTHPSLPGMIYTETP